MQSDEERFLPPPFVKNSLNKEDEELITSNRVKLETVVKAEYVEYDIKKEPKYEDVKNEIRTSSSSFRHVMLQYCQAQVRSPSPKSQSQDQKDLG